jgi:hypothetical protein
MPTPTSEEQTERYTWVQRANHAIVSQQSLMLAWFCWIAIAVMLAYSIHYVRVIRSVTPRITVRDDGDGCAFVCFVKE